jgi:hypothetical protein
MLFVCHFAGEEDAVFLSVRPEDREDAFLSDGPAEIEKAGFFVVIDSFGEESNAEGVLEGFFDFLWGDLAKIEWGVEPVEVHVELFGTLDKLDLVALGRIDEGNHASTAGWDWTVAEGIALGGGVFGESIHIIDFKGEMGQIRAYDNGPARGVVADLDFLVAAPRLKENQGGASGRGRAARFLQPKHVLVEAHRAIEFGDAVSSMKKALNHQKDFGSRFSFFGL